MPAFKLFFALVACFAFWFAMAQIPFVIYLLAGYAAIIITDKTLGLFF